MTQNGRPIFIQCGCWGELCSPYEVARPPDQYWIKIAHPWVQKFYPVLGLGSGERLLLHFQTPVLYWINFIQFAILSRRILGPKKSTQTFFVQSFSTTLRIVDVRAENRGRLHQKVRFPAAPGGGEKLFDPWASGRKGQECPREIRTKKFMFMLFFAPWNLISECLFFFFVFAWEFYIEKRRGFLVNFFWSPSPTKRSTKSLRGKFGAKFGTRIRKIRETFVLQLFWPIFSRHFLRKFLLFSVGWPPPKPSPHPSPWILHFL